MVLISLQSLLSSVLWNYFMINYHNILETNMESVFTGKELTDGVVFCYCLTRKLSMTVTQLYVFIIIFFNILFILIYFYFHSWAKLN